MTTTNVISEWNIFGINEISNYIFLLSITKILIKKYNNKPFANIDGNIDMIMKKFVMMIILNVHLTIVIEHHITNNYNHLNHYY